MTDTDRGQKLRKIDFLQNFTQNTIMTEYRWDFIEIQSVLKGDFGNSGRFKSNVCFDLDSTIIKPLNGRTFPKNHSDWMFLYTDIPDKLRIISKTNNIIIFSNQLGLKTDTRRDTFKLKIEMMYKSLDIPFKIFASTNRNHYRKPCIGMWNLLDSSMTDTSIYIGDAAGRPGDFSDSDKKFAENIGIPFFTPEEFFLGKNEFILKKQQSL
jgi:bifunctional polynucleotide phosphatase/kinase